MKTLYLGGSITQDERHWEWRERMKTWAWGRCFVLDPLDVNDRKNVSEDGLVDVTMPGRVFVARDRMCIEESDVVMFVFWKGLARQSVGTWTELGWASKMGLPIVLVTDDPDVKAHPFVEALVTTVVPSIDEAQKMLEVLIQ